MAGRHPLIDNHPHLKNWEAKDDAVYVGSDCILMADTDNAPHAVNVRKARMAAAAPLMEQALNEIANLKFGEAPVSDRDGMLRAVALLDRARDIAYAGLERARGEQ